MDSLSETHFLQPCVTSTDDGPISDLPRHHGQQSLSLTPSDIKLLSSKIESTGFRLPSPEFTSWVLKMETLHSPTWKKAGIFEAIKASMVKIPKDPSLILALVEKWCPETNTFIFPWGEATITLEDVNVLLGFSVLGSCVNAPLDSLEGVLRLERGRVENRRSDGRILTQSWISSFSKISDDGIEHEAFLTMWLSDYVFPDTWRRSISGKVLPLAVRLARGEKIALAPAVLASLYRDLSRIHKSEKRVKLESLFKLVQVWIWERFKNIGPEPREMGMGESRIARWCLTEMRCEGNVSFDEFVWRPYAKALKNWSCPKFYVKEGKWVSVGDSVDEEFVSFARCLRVSCLVGIGFVEEYYPNRVAMQFGFDQELPGLVSNHCGKTEEEAWDDYNKSLDGLKLYIPSRLADGSVTKRYQEWWVKSVAAFLSSKDDHDVDHDDAPLMVLPLSKVVQKLRKGFHAELKQCKKRRKGKNVGSSSREVTLSELFRKKLTKRSSEHLRDKRRKRACEEGDDITIAEIGRSRKNNEGDASESLLGKRSRNDDEVYVRFDIKKGIGKISDCGGSSTSREMPLTELFQELEKRTSEHLLKQACEDDDHDITIAEMVKSRKNTGGDAAESLGTRSGHEEYNNGSGICEKIVSVDETVALQEIEPRIEVNDEEEERGIDLPLGSNGGMVEAIVPPQELKQNCDDVNGGSTEKETMIDVGTKEEENLVHENGENQREKLCSEECEVKTEEEEIDERLKQRKLRIEEIALKLEARMMKADKTLAKIRDWKIKRNQMQTRVPA